jgi:hypothetical protein
MCRPAGILQGRLAGAGGGLRFVGRFFDALVAAFEPAALLRAPVIFFLAALFFVAFFFVAFFLVAFLPAAVRRRRTGFRFFPAAAAPVSMSTPKTADRSSAARTRPRPGLRFLPARPTASATSSAGSTPRSANSSSGAWSSRAPTP